MSPVDTPTIYLGLDIAKDSLQLDATVLPALPSVPNTRAGHQRLCKALHKLQTQTKTQVHLVLEATGGYERLLEDCLHEANILFSRVMPKRVRSLADAHSILAKTDAIDAKVLTLFGQKINPSPTQPQSPSQRDLADFTQRRNQLMSMLVQEKNRLPAHRHPEIIKEAKNTIAQLNKKIEHYDVLIRELGTQDVALSNNVKRLCQIKGVASTTAYSVLAAMPELGTLNRREVAALAGLAPRNRDSGAKQGKRVITGGRAHARRALYMAALSASRSNSILQPFYQNLINSGKPAKSALTAVMRKLICLMNNLLKNPDFTLA